jgi:uncharacterized membrane protein YdjX (TVP38/TMEM64 family)
VRGNAFRIVIVITALLMLAWIALEAHGQGLFSRDGLLSLRDRFGAGAPLAIIGALVVAVVIGPIPTIPITVTSGVLFGPVAGFGYAMIGGLIGAAVSFQIARIAGRPLAARFLGGHIALCADCSDKLLFWLVAGCRVVPIISFAAVSYGAGLTAMRIRAFLVATGIGMIPMTGLYVGLGAAIEIDPLRAALGGLVAVVLMLTLPVLIERHDPFGVMRFFRHAEPGDAERRRP